MPMVKKWFAVCCDCGKEKESNNLPEGWSKILGGELICRWCAIERYNDEMEKQEKLASAAGVSLYDFLELKGE